MHTKAILPVVIMMLVAVLYTVHVTLAHDIWFFPERFMLSKGDTLVVHQLAGTELASEVELPLLRRMTSRFEFITPHGLVDLLGQLPDIRKQPTVQPVLRRQLDFEGLALLGMEQDFIQTEFSRQEFLAYLRHEEKPPTFRHLLGEKPRQRERYARSLKCLVQVGKVTENSLYRRVLGHTIEILLLQNPYLLGPGAGLEVRVLYDGEPLRDQLVMAFNGDGKRPASRATARTNADGIARFNLERDGVWLMRLVYLRHCSQSSEIDCSEVDWESHWASYIFEIP